MSRSLWGCFSGGYCLKGCCCPCLLIGEIHHRQQYGKRSKGCNNWCLSWTLLQCCGLGFVLQALDRKLLNDDTLCSLCTSFFCCQCEAIRTSKELDDHEEKIRNTVTQNSNGYQKPQGMVIEAPDSRIPDQSKGPGQAKGRSRQNDGHLNYQNHLQPQFNNGPWQRDPGFNFE